MEEGGRERQREEGRGSRRRLLDGRPGLPAGDPFPLETRRVGLGEGEDGGRAPRGRRGVV